MKYLILATLVVAGFATPAWADSSAHVSWGTKVGKGGQAPVDEHYSLGVIAGQVNDGAGLSGIPRYNTYSNYTCGVCTQVDIHGDGNDVNVNGTNSGDTTGTQGIGGGNINQIVQH